MGDNNVAVPKAAPPKDTISSSSDKPDGSSGKRGGGKDNNKAVDKVKKEAIKAGAKSGASTVAGAQASSMATTAVGGAISKGIAAATGFVDKAVGAVVGAAKGLVNAGIKVIGSVFGTGSLTLTGVVVVSSGVVIVGGGSALVHTNSEAAVFSESTVYEEDCLTLDYDVGDSEDGSALTDEQVMKNAYVIYSSFTQYGFTDAQAYGMLSNMYHESHLYPSMCQGHISTPFFGESVANPANYVDNGGGVGLVQWSPTGAKSNLYTASVASGYNWYDLEFQVAFLLSEADVNWPATQQFFSVTSGFSASDCSKWFLKNWERCGGASSASDYTDAGDSGTPYNGRWNSAQADVESIELTIQQCIINYASDAALNASITNILAHASTMSSSGAANITASSACSYGSYDNSSLSNAAVSFSWPKKELANNNGTALYQKVYNNVLTERSYYKSCDRGVMCAVAWSGTDDNFATLGGVGNIYAYLNSTGSSKWDYVGKIGYGISMADCLPGDILIITAEQRNLENGHIVIYTGEEAIKSVHGDLAPVGANVIAASLDEYSPCAQVWTDSYAINYSVYRCSNPDKSTTFAGAGGNEATN